MTGPAITPALWLLGLILTVPVSSGAEAATSDEVIKMEPFNVTAYGGKIPILDGFTGKDYKGNNDVVFHFAASSRMSSPSNFRTPRKFMRSTC